MSISPTSLKVATVGAVLALGAGVGVAASANAATSPSPAPSTSGSAADNGSGSAANNGTGAATAPGQNGDRGPRAGHGGPGGPGMGRGGVDAAALAKKLGLDEAKVTAAIQKVREAQKPAAPSTGTGSTANGSTSNGSGSTSATKPTPPTEAERAARQKAFAAALAKELGITEAKVTAALDALRAEHKAAEKSELSTRLDAAVKAGTLTATDKASVLKAFDAGVLRGGPGAR